MDKEQKVKSLYSNETFGKNLKQLRKNKGYTQEKLLSKFEEYEGITLDSRQYRDYENNKINSDISSQRLYVLSDILGVSMNDLIGKTFDTKSMDETVFNSTGLNSKSIDILKRKKKSQEIRHKRMGKNSMICDAISALGEVDTLNYLIANSNVLTSFTNNARLIYFRMLELQQGENKLKAELNNTNDKREKKLLNKKLLEIKDRKKDLVDYQSFNLYKEVDKTFKKYLQYLTTLDTQHYITKK